jgi:large subunit ribosomal protein L20
MRIKSGSIRHRKKKRFFKEAEGRVGGRRRLWRTVVEGVVKGRVYAYSGRKRKKRDLRALWITRLHAATVMRGLSYSRFIHGLKLANIRLNRRTLSELAIREPQVFDEIFALVQGALSQAA